MSHRPASLSAVEQSRIKKRCAAAFAERLRDLREGRGMTRHELAYSLDWHPSAIERYENRPLFLPHLNKLVVVADLFGVSLDWLVGREG